MATPRNDLLDALDTIRAFLERSDSDADNLPQEGNIDRYDDAFGDPIEFSQEWDETTHFPPPYALRERLAGQALDGKCREFVAQKQAQGQRIDFDHTELVRIDGQWANSTTNWTGLRKCEFGGVAVGHLYFRRR